MLSRVLCEGIEKKTNKILDMDSICCGQVSKLEPQEYKTHVMDGDTFFLWYLKVDSLECSHFYTALSYRSKVVP